MKDLIARLEAATEGSRELDAAIANLVWGDKAWRALPDGSAQAMMEHPDGDGWIDCGEVPHFTTSVDAAIALVPPGFAWKVGTCHVSDDAWVVPDLNCPAHGERLRKQFEPLQQGSIWDTGIDIDQRPAGRPAIALCIAALTARMEMAK